MAPYEKWVYYDSRIHQQEQDRNYATNKTKKVAWFVSNCGENNGRLKYARELGKYIDVCYSKIEIKIFYNISHVSPFLG